VSAPASGRFGAVRFFGRISTVYGICPGLSRVTRCDKLRRGFRERAMLKNLASIGGATDGDVSMRSRRRVRCASEYVSYVGPHCNGCSCVTARPGSLERSVTPMMGVVRTRTVEGLPLLATNHDVS
jgi:hypothetical protein